MFLPGKDICLTRERQAARDLWRHGTTSWRVTLSCDNSCCELPIIMSHICKLLYWNINPS